MSQANLRNQSPEALPGKVHSLANRTELDRISELEAQMSAVNRTQAVIEFNLDGTVICANSNFLSVLGYTLEEIQGRHHSMFCSKEHASSPEYRLFWERMQRGEFQAGEFSRISKSGGEVVIQASYNPIIGTDGKPYKVIKFASDISQQKLKDAELAALSKTQAVINFKLDGTIVSANNNFLNTVGYSLDEVVGKHHSMFCDPAFSRSSEYRDFWDKLNRGQFEAGEFKRIAKGGREVWLNAAYNPVYDLSGKVFKVVKYATDITKQKQEFIQLVTTLTETSTQLGAAAEELTATAKQLADNAQRTTSQSTSAAAASEEVTKGVSSVATNTEEMTAAIKEIAKNTYAGSEKTKESLKKAQETNALVTQLGEESKAIGTVIKTISSIAQQTNLV